MPNDTHLKTLYIGASPSDQVQTLNDGDIEVALNIYTHNITLSGTTSTGALLISGNTLSSTELGYVDGITPGIVTASKAVVVDSGKKQDYLDVLTTFKISGTTVGTTAAELNVLSGVTAGTLKAGSSLVVDTSGEIDTLAVTGDVTLSSGVTLGTDFVTVNTRFYGTNSFSGTTTGDTVTIVGMLDTDRVSAHPYGTAITAEDILITTTATGSFTVERPSTGGTSGLSYFYVIYRPA